MIANAPGPVDAEAVWHKATGPTVGAEEEPEDDLEGLLVWTLLFLVQVVPLLF